MKPGKLVLLGLALALGLAALPAQAGQTNETPVPERKKVFIFEGGNPFDLILAMDRHFRTRLVQILTLPETLRRTEVPKLRVPAEDPRDVLTLYNRLESPTLGQWRYEPQATASNLAGTNMNVLMLVPDKNVVATRPLPIKVKALPLGDVPPNKWDRLAADIEVARRVGEEISQGTADTYKGTSVFQRESKVLIISGSEPFIETVESVVTAYRTNQQLESETKPAAPSK